MTIAIRKIRSCLDCEHRSRLLSDRCSSYYELWCEAKSEVIARLPAPRKLQKVASQCELFEDQK